jgi:hypothetical protein
VYDEPLKLNELRTTSSSTRPVRQADAADHARRQAAPLVRNMIYDGVLSQLLSIDMAQMEKALRKQLARSRRRST